MNTTRPSKDSKVGLILTGGGALMIAWLTAGCASMNGLAPRSQLGAPSDLQAAKILAEAGLVAADWPRTEWWKDWGDGQLNQLEMEALADSPTLKAARARVDKALAFAGVARSTLWPQVNGNFDSTRQRFSENDMLRKPLAGSWRTESRLALDFSYEFDFWGKNRAALAAAVNETEAARVDAFAARLLLSVAVARTYVQLARIDDQLDVANATLKQRQLSAGYHTV